MRSLGSFVLLIGNEKTKVDLRIPLKYYLASEETKNSEGFHLSCPKCKERIRQKNICPVCNDEVSYSDTEKLFEVSKEKSITFTKEEYKTLFENEKSIEVRFMAIVNKEKINPIMRQKNPYYLIPVEEKSKQINERNNLFFGMLKEALGSEYEVIAEATLRNVKYLIGISNFDNVLLMELLHYPDEIRQTPETSEATLTAEAKAQAKEWIKNLVGDFDFATHLNENKEAFKKTILDIIQNGKKPIVAVENKTPFIATENPFAITN